MKDYYEPTDKEAEAIDRSALDAAWKELQPLINDELPIPNKVLIFLRAFQAANEAAKKCEEALLASHPKKQRVIYSLETTDIVCNALIALDMDSTLNVHPHSVLGARISALIQAAKALEAMSTVYSAFDDDDGIFGTYLAAETGALANAVIGNRHRTV